MSHITHIIERIIFDTREAKLYSAFSPELLDKTKVEPLTIGDIVFRSNTNTDVIVFERKSLSDLLASIKDGRYEEQSHRLIHASGVPPHRIIYIIEGMFSTLRTPGEKQLVISAMTSLQLYKGFSVVRTSSVQETADLIAGMWKKIKRNEEKGLGMYELMATQTQTQPLKTETETETEGQPLNESATEEIKTNAETQVPAYCAVVKKVKKDNITPENIGEIILCQIPGISSTIAVELMRKYGNIRGLLEMVLSRPEELKDIKINGRKLGSNVVSSMLRYLG